MLGKKKKQTTNNTHTTTTTPHKPQFRQYVLPATAPFLLWPGQTSQSLLFPNSSSLTGKTPQGSETPFQTQNKSSSSCHLPVGSALAQPPARLPLQSQPDTTTNSSAFQPGSFLVLAPWLRREGWAKRNKEKRHQGHSRSRLGALTKNTDPAQPAAALSVRKAWLDPCLM